MEFITMVSDLMIPLVFLFIIIYGLLNKNDVYDTFIEGAKEGITIIIKIMPTLIGLMVAVGMFRASGAMGILVKIVEPITDIIKFPSELVPIAIMRTISSSATTGLVLDLFKVHGPDSYIGRMASIMMGCTETIFYTMSIYFMSINIKKTRYTLAGALIANAAGIIASVYLTMKIFG